MVSGGPGQLLPSCLHGLSSRNDAHLFPEMVEILLRNSVAWNIVSLPNVLQSHICNSHNKNKRELKVIFKVLFGLEIFKELNLVSEGKSSC